VGIEVVYKGNFKEVLNALDETAKKRMSEAVISVQKETIQNLRGEGKGWIYFVPHTKTTYRASAPGDFPASATGILRKSIKQGLEGDGISLQGFVGTDVKYGPMLEFGTKHMAPRPWLRRTFEEMEGRIQEVFRRVWF
jgi:HK97 gp10 family phage protein